jgi:phenylacetate-CoA ligase
LRLNVLRPADEIAATLRRFSPDIITGLPSALLEAGSAQHADVGPLTPRALFTSGELLQRSTRDALERMYATRVFDVYGTSETKEIAWECRLGRRHVNADVIAVEIVDPAGRTLPSGQEGEIVATVLVNHAMPLLRYRTGDWGSLLTGRCPCGRATPLLGVVTGRETETLVFVGGRRISPYALTCTMEQIPGLHRYQIVQLGPAHLTVRAIVSGTADRGAIADRVRATLRLEVASTLDVRVEFVERLPTGPQAKFRVVQRMEAL